LVVDLRRAFGGEEDTVWYDSSGGLQGGDAWWTRITAELTARPIFVVLLSRAALASKWVLDELALAWQQKNASAGKVILPVLVEPCEAPPFLATLQFVSFVATRPYEEALDELVRAIRTSGLRAAQLERGPTTPLGLPFEEDLLLVPAHFVGREQDLAWVEEHLQAGGATAIVALGGLGGIGKTALAAVAIHQLRRAGTFPDGIVVVLCQHLTDSTEVLARVLTRFDPQRKTPEETTLADLARRARYALQGKKALVVLDNVEPGLSVAEVAEPLQAAGVTLLLTARQSLPNEVVPAGASRTLDLLSPEKALELLAWALGREHPDALSSAEHAAAGRIVAALGRHTLAVRLAGAYAAGAGRDLAALASELEQEPLEVPTADTPRGVALILARSTAALPEGARQLFAALSVFATPEFGRQAAGALAAGLDQTQPRASVDVVVQRALADASVSEALPEDADRERLRLHPLVRAFAADLRARWPKGEQEAAALAIARYLAGYAEPRRNEYVALVADEGNLTGALAWTLGHGQPALTVDIAYGLGRFWLDRGRFRDATQYLRWIVAPAAAGDGADAKAPDDVRVAELALDYAEALTYDGALDEAEEAGQRGLRGFRANGARAGEGRALAALGNIASRRGRSEEADDYFRQALAIAREVGDLTNEGEALTELGSNALERGRPGEAEGYLRAALPIHRETGDRVFEAITLNYLGYAARQRGKPEEAEGYFQLALPLDRALQNRHGEAVTLSFLGQAALQRDQVDRAANYLEQSLTIARELQDRRIEQSVLGTLGHAERVRGNLSQAERYFRQSMAIAREIHDRGGEGAGLSNLGQVVQQQGRIDEAEGYLEQALVICREVQDRRFEARTLRTLATIAENRQEWDRAEALTRESLEIATLGGLGPEIPDAQMVLGRLLCSTQGRPDEGCPLLLDAAARYAEMGNAAKAAEARETAQRLGCSA
jgi:tetratricopeptide (TPR) repeat protein